MNKFMELAIKEAYEGIELGDGGPFGCIIVKDGKVVGRGHNMVLACCDPTAHGEMEAIRDACQRLRTFDLSGCELYTTSEPCIMCLGAILWANITKVYYGCTISDADTIGFRDDIFDKDIKTFRSNIQTPLMRDDCLKLFEDYLKTDPTNY